MILVRYSVDGSRLFTAGYPSGVLQFWDSASGKEVRRIETPAGYRGSADYAHLPADWSTVYVPWEKRKVVNFQKDGKRDWRIDMDGAILVYDTATGRQRPALKPAPGHSVVTCYLSPDGHKLVALERSSFHRGKDAANTVILWDTEKGIHRPLGEGYPMVAFTADSTRFLMSLHMDKPEFGVLKLFTSDGTEIAELDRVEGQRISSPMLAPDGKRFVVQEGKGRIDRPAMLRVWDLSSPKRIASFPPGGKFPFGATAWSPDSRRLAAVDYNGGVRVWDVVTGHLLLQKRFGETMRTVQVAFSPDSRRLAVEGLPKGESAEDRDPDPSDLPQPRVFLFDLASPTTEPEVVVCPHGYTGGLAFAPDGKTLAVGGAGAVHLFDMTHSSRSEAKGY